MVTELDRLGLSYLTTLLSISNAERLGYGESEHCLRLKQYLRVLKARMRLEANLSPTAGACHRTRKGLR